MLLFLFLLLFFDHSATFDATKPLQLLTAAGALCLDVQIALSCRLPLWVAPDQPPMTDSSLMHSMNL
jgi:hypothetical protein